MCAGRRIAQYTQMQAVACATNNCNLYGARQKLSDAQHAPAHLPLPARRAGHPPVSGAALLMFIGHNFLPIP